MTDGTGFTATTVAAAAPDAVFAHLTRPDLFAHWWVVDGFTTPAAEFRLDPRPGGAASMLAALASSVAATASGGNVRTALPGQVRPLSLPLGFVAPADPEHADLHAHAIGRADLDDDVARINASLDVIRRTRGGRWPIGPVTADNDCVDLVWCECEFRDGKSFTDAVHHDDGCIGCCYLYPVGVRTPLTEDLLRHDVDVSGWVTPDAYRVGRYRTLYEAL